MEPWWNKAVQQQAIDRMHRIGQNQHVFAYNMICKDTIEEKIIALQNKKQSISDEVIGNDENFVKNLSKWGIRRQLGNHFNYETGIGIGYRYFFKENFSGQIALDLHLRIGYHF